MSSHWASRYNSCALDTSSVKFLCRGGSKWHACKSEAGSNYVFILVTCRHSVFLEEIFKRQKLLTWFSIFDLWMYENNKLEKWFPYTNIISCFNAIDPAMSGMWRTTPVPTSPLVCAQQQLFIKNCVPEICFLSIWFPGIR